MLNALVLSRTAYVPGLVRDDINGHYHKSREKYLHQNKKVSRWRYNLLSWLRDHVHPNIPSLYYRMVLGHDLHVSTYAELYLRHFHASAPDPFNPSIIGWWENIGLVSRHKVTVAFRTFEITNLVTDSTEYGDYKFHRVGTSSAAEDNTHTALQTDAGITGVTGTQVNADPIYRSVATVTADATEVWAEHGIFSQAGTATPAGTMMDRNLISPTVSVVSGDTCQFTFELTKSAEA